MAIALGLARRSLGATWPNPSVGCVLVQQSDRGPVIVGRGWTAPGGRPHAEPQALERAGSAAEGSTAYVTLEPCSHHGQTPPCADALIKAGIARVVIAVEDSDPRVSGQGTKALRNAGVAVSTGIRAKEAAELNAGFFMRIESHRPLITVKFATTLDGRIATATGDSQWITGERARAIGHGLRAVNDAVAVGIGTVLADDPELTCRLPDMHARSPVRVVFDSALRLPLDCRIAKGARDFRSIVLTCRGHDPSRRQSLEDMGVEVIEVEAGQDGRVELTAALQTLAGLGLTRLLCEGGSGLAGAFVRQNLADRIAWFRGPAVIGGDGLSAIAALGVESLDEAPSFTRTGMTRLGQDTLETYRRET